MNRRASHFLITGASRNNHAVEPSFWLLFVNKTRFWSGFWQYRTCKYNEWQLGFQQYFGWDFSAKGHWHIRTTLKFGFWCGSNMWCLSFDIGEMRKIIFCLSLRPVVKGYGITVRLHPGCHNVSGRCWMWLSSSRVCYATMVLHWLLHTKKQNGVRYNRRNHRCCKPYLCRVLILWQCSRPDGGHGSCSALSWISSTQPQGVSCDPSRISTGLYRTRPCLPRK